jgi:hypothetical protein
MAGKVNSTLPEPRIFTAEEIASFLLTGAVDEEDYQGAREAVREMGLDPDQIDHLKVFELWPSPTISSSSTPRS